MVNGATTVSHSLGWNANGTLSTSYITDNYQTADSQLCRYAYDEFSRVTSANCGAGWGQNFGYDPWGNMSKFATAGSAESFLANYTINNQIWKLQSGSPSYDANGNMLTDGLHSYTWDAEGKNVTMDGNGAIMTYDALGGRGNPGTGNPGTGGNPGKPGDGAHVHLISSMSLPVTLNTVVPFAACACRHNQGNFVSSMRRLYKVKAKVEIGMFFLRG